MDSSITIWFVVAIVVVAVVVLAVRAGRRDRSHEGGGPTTPSGGADANLPGER